MSSIPPEERNDEAPAGAPQQQDDGPVVSLPKWVGTALALVLIVMAALAVWTGLRYRGGALETKLIDRSTARAARSVEQSGGAPGEPEPGASRVMPGDSGELVPQANPVVTKGPAISITGSGKDILPSRRLLARRGVVFHVTPPDTLVYVNDVAIGPVNQFDTAADAYDLPAEGSFTIRLVAPGYREVEYIVNADANAKDEVATVETKLQK